MNNNMYIIPANAKKGKLIFNLFYPIDLVILLCGIFLTFIFLLTIKSDELSMLVIKLLPVGIACILVFPFPYYHNGRVYIKEIYNYLTKQRRYIWRGWCSWYDEK